MRAYATNSVGTAYGNQISFTTLVPPWQCGDTINYSGQIYNTVLIGSLCWMKENLNVGTMIPGSQNQINNSQIEKYCYNNDPVLCTEYGGLYQWDEMMQYITTQGTQGICPNGWHIPTDAEWTTLTTLLGGITVAGGKMKEEGFLHWTPPNTGATNESNFTGLPGGRYNTVEVFEGVGEGAYMWSSTESSSTQAWCRLLEYYHTQVVVSPSHKIEGYSVRCLKD